MSASTSTAPAPAPASVLFARGVIARLALWPALRIAVDEGWGGPEGAAKRTWMASVLVDAFEEEDPVPDATYVEEMLLQIMADEFDTELEDGSAEAVARDVVRMWADAGAGAAELIRGFEAQAEKVKGKKVQVEEAAGEGSDWEDESGEEDEDEAPMLVDAQPNPKPEPEVDEDGFTTVKGKSSRHR